MESEEYMNRKQQEAEIAEVSIFILTITITVVWTSMHCGSYLGTHIDNTTIQNF